jgi:hypothetical protein
MPPQSTDTMTDLSPLQIPGMEGIWPGTLHASEEMLDHLFGVTDQGDLDELGVPREISISPHQLTLEIEARHTASQ